MKNNKVAVIAANGKMGQLIVDELVKRNFDVTVIVRTKNNTKANKAIIKDIFDITKEDLLNFDFVVDAFGVWKDEDLHLHTDSLKHLTNQLKGSNVRLIYVGGAGSLYVSDNTMLYQTADFPKIYYNLAKEQANAYLYLKDQNNLNWTFFSPAANLMYDGEQKNKYKIAGDYLTLDSNGESSLSYKDFALAIVDEIEKGNHINERISIVWP